MATIRPFKATHPAHGLYDKIAALPYDVLNRREAKAEVKRNPYSFLKIDRAETTMDDSVNKHDVSVFKKARENFLSFIDEGKFVREPEESYYLYELTKDGRSQTGLVATCFVDEYGSVIKKHEETRKSKEIDRVNHVEHVKAHTGPIFLTYKDEKEITDLIEEQKKGTPIFDFVSDDGVRHRGWKVEKDVEDELTSLFGKLDSLYIADGHHRCASAVAVAEKVKAPEARYFLSVLFPASELHVYDYNRVVSDLNGLTPEAFISRIKEDFTVTPKTGEVHPEKEGQFGMFLDGKWYLLEAKEKPEGVVASLDVSILYDKILSPVLGIGDQRTDKRISFVGGVRGLKELEDRTGEGVAFSLYPTSIDKVITVADMGLTMPPKSTWFEPKLRSGLFIHEF